MSIQQQPDKRRFVFFAALLGACAGVLLRPALVEAVECSYSLRADLVEVRLVEGTADPESQNIWRSRLGIGALGDNRLETQDLDGDRHTSLQLEPDET